MFTTSASYNAPTPNARGPVADPFAILGLEARFDLSDAEITAAYRSKARECHPDRFAGADAAELADATRRSAAVNDAYRVLLNPVWRADYMLRACGGPGPDAVRDVPPDLLGEVMMLREQIDADAACGNHEALARHRASVEASRRAALETIAQATRRLPNASEAEKRSLRISINAMKYYENLLEQLAPDPLNRDAG